MKITSNGFGSIQGVTTRSSNSARGDSPTGASKTQSPRGDSVQISAEAMALQKSRPTVESSVDRAKVERLKAAIDSGSYQVNAERLAGKMMDLDKSF